MSSPHFHTLRQLLEQYDTSAKPAEPSEAPITDAGSVEFQVMGYNDVMDSNWRMATIYDVETNTDKVVEVLADKEWHICSLVDGKVKGPGYGHEITHGAEEMGHKLVIKDGNVVAPEGDLDASEDETNGTREVPGTPEEEIDATEDEEDDACEVCEEEEEGDNDVKDEDALEEGNTEDEGKDEDVTGGGKEKQEGNTEDDIKDENQDEQEEKEELIPEDEKQDENTEDDVENEDRKSVCLPCSIL